MNKKLTVLIAIIVVAALAGWLFYGQREARLQISDLATMADGREVNISLGKCQMTVKVVNSPQSITQGLSDRDEIGADGMLFVMPSKAKHSFWMLDMRFDLDIIFLANSQVIDIKADVPYPDKDTAREDLPRYAPVKEADLILELNTGRAAECEIGTGDALHLL